MEKGSLSLLLDWRHCLEALSNLCCLIGTKLNQSLLPRKWRAVLSVAGKRDREDKVDLSYVHQSHLTYKTASQWGREIIETTPMSPLQH